MKRQYLYIIFLALTFVILIESTSAQRHGRANLNEDVPLPTDFAVDYQLASAQRAQIRGGSSLLEGTEYNEAGLRVFSEFLQDSSVSSLNLPYQWNFTIVNDGSINAYSLPDGEVSVGSGLAKLIGTSPGMWAAVLSHETAHVARRHWVRKYLYELYIAAQIQYYEARARAGDNSANWSLVGIRVAAPIARAKLSRDLEHDADIHGMMLMARAGYHPDYVFALHHLLRATTGEQSHVAAFFSSHPRWETRDQRDDRAYADALAEFDRLWPDPEASPGGKPPLVAFLDKPTSQENQQMKTADLTLPIYCRNATEPLQLAVLFLKDKHLVQAAGGQDRDQQGDLVFRQGFDCSEKTEASPIAVQLPTTLISGKDRKLQAMIYVYSKSGELLDSFKALDVHFPKP